MTPEFKDEVCRRFKLLSGDLSHEILFLTNRFGINVAKICVYMNKFTYNGSVHILRHHQPHDTVKLLQIIFEDWRLGKRIPFKWPDVEVVS